MTIAYATRSDFIRIGQENLSANLTKVVRAESRQPENATFLSHSSKDDELMPAVVSILESHGATVYLDKKDQSLSTKHPRDIATYLRDKIERARKFVLFASDNVKSSTWVPWELGLADGYRKPRNVCIFPAVENALDSSWTEQEYLGIYDRIIWGNFKSEETLQWLVYDQRANSAVRLKDWLAR